MNKNLSHILSALITLLIVTPTFATPGSTTANFLKIGMGGRAAAMGEAQSALANDVSAAYWNPAALSALRYQEVLFMHNQLVESVRHQQAAYAYPTPQRGVFSAGISMMDYGSIQGYDDASLPTSQVDASNLLMSFSWAKQPFKDTLLQTGATLKYLQSDLAGYKASSPMLDLGIQLPFHEGRLRGLNLAAVARNVGGKIKYDSESSDLPQQFVLGAGLSSLGGNLHTGIDLISSKDNGSYAALGLEYRVFEMLNLRVGYNGKSDFVGNGLTYGMGLQFNQWSLDYAMVPFGDLGNTNRVSVNVRFGRALEIKDAGDQVEGSFRRAERLLSHGKAVEAYGTVNEILLIAPWHKPSAELKAKIESQFAEMAVAKNRAQLDADVADKFTAAKAAFDRDELVQAKKGFETILMLQPDHVGSQVYVERINNRYKSLAFESFKQGMDYFAAGDYEKAKRLFEKTLTIDEEHVDAKAQLETTKRVMADANQRAEEMAKLAGAADAYKEGLAAYQKNDFETALVKFEEVKLLVPSYEEGARYLSLTQTTLANILYEKSQTQVENGLLDEAVASLTRARQLNPDDARIRPALESAARDLNIKNAENSKKAYQEGLESYLGGNSEKAVKSWKRALELDSTNDDAQKALNKLNEQKMNEKPE